MPLHFDKIFRHIPRCVLRPGGVGGVGLGMCHSSPLISFQNSVLTIMTKMKKIMMYTKENLAIIHRRRRSYTVFWVLCQVRSCAENLWNFSVGWGGKGLVRGVPPLWGVHPLSFFDTSHAWVPAPKKPIPGQAARGCPRGRVFLAPVFLCQDLWPAWGNAKKTIGIHSFFTPRSQI